MICVPRMRRVVVLLRLCVLSRAKPLPALRILGGERGIFIQGARHEHGLSFLGRQGRGGGCRKGRRRFPPGAAENQRNEGREVKNRTKGLVHERVHRGWNIRRRKGTRDRVLTFKTQRRNEATPITGFRTTTPASHPAADRAGPNLLPVLVLSTQKTRSRRVACGLELSDLKREPNCRMLVDIHPTSPKREQPFRLSCRHRELLKEAAPCHKSSIRMLSGLTIPSPA